MLGSGEEPARSSGGPPLQLRTNSRFSSLVGGQSSQSAPPTARGEASPREGGRAVLRPVLSKAPVGHPARGQQGRVPHASTTRPPGDVGPARRRQGLSQGLSQGHPERHSKGDARRDARRAVRARRGEGEARSDDATGCVVARRGGGEGRGGHRRRQEREGGSGAPEGEWRLGRRAPPHAERWHAGRGRRRWSRVCRLVS